jgi:hypothetical protein
MSFSRIAKKWEATYRTVMFGARSTAEEMGFSLTDCYKVPNPFRPSSGIATAFQEVIVNWKQ